MANEYITFNNNTQPALNAQNLNLMQQMIKEDIEQGGGGSATGDTLPIGSMMPFSGSTVPTNWLECNGQAVSRTTYALLFAVIGTTYGTGDGSTTFNLPNLKGRVVVGQDTSDTDFNTLGKKSGEKKHTLTINEMPSHNHNVTTVYPFTIGANLTSIANSTANNPTGLAGDVVKNAGGGQAHNILQPYIVEKYIIKAFQSAGVLATVVDNLVSTSSTDALSAKQGKVLDEKIALQNCYCLATSTINSQLGGDFKVLLNQIVRQKGNKFNLNSSQNRIVVGAGVHTVEISANIFNNWPDQNGYVWGQIKKNGSQVATTITPYSAGGFLSTPIPSKIINVSEGDYFELIADSTCHGELRPGENNTWFQIRAID